MKYCYQGTAIPGLACIISAVRDAQIKSVLASEG